MKDGTAITKFDYQETPGAKRTTWLTNTDVSNPGTPLQSTTDPEWMVQIPGDPVAHGPFEWLTCLGTDGEIWITKVHCQWEPGGLEPPVAPYIRAWFEFRRKSDGAFDHDGDALEFVGWDNIKWRVTIPSMDGPFPRQPAFFLKLY